MSVTWLAWAASAARLRLDEGADVDGDVQLGLRRAEPVAVVADLGPSPGRTSAPGVASSSWRRRRGCT